jgi:hypothetical protein
MSEDPEYARDIIPLGVRRPRICPWEWSLSPWERVHIDFEGPFLDRMFFVLVDAHSKWPEIIEVKTTTSTKF